MKRTSKSGIAVAGTIAVLAAWFIGGRAWAGGIPTRGALTYSGVLQKPDGSPLSADGHNLELKLWSTGPTGGTALCDTAVPAPAFTLDSSGRFSVQLDDTCTSAIGATPGAFIEILLDGNTLGRTKLGAVPYAIEANHADSATTLVGPQAQQIVPSGAISFFNLAACPNGWTEVTAAQGRYLVGLPASGTLAATVGTALSSAENRAVGQHSHGVTDPGHAHGVTDPGHGHGVTDPGHGHGVAAGNQYVFWNTSTCAGNVGYFPSGTGNCLDAQPSTANSLTNVSIKSAGTGVGVNSSTTGVSIANSGGVLGTNAPYIQLRVCQKS